MQIFFVLHNNLLVRVRASDMLIDGNALNTLDTLDTTRTRDHITLSLFPAQYQSLSQL